MTDVKDKIAKKLSEQSAFSDEARTPLNAAFRSEREAPPSRVAKTVNEVFSSAITGRDGAMWIERLAGLHNATDAELAEGVRYAIREYYRIAELTR